MKASEFDYEPPPELIAQRPLAERDSSRLMKLDRSTGRVTHHVFRDLPELLAPGDLLVLNDTRVVPARLFGRREETGGKVEVLLLEELPDGRWRAFTKSGGKLRRGEHLKLAGGRVRARLVRRLGEEGDVLEVVSGEPVAQVMESAGYMPVPPYVRRSYVTDPHAGEELDPMTLVDRERYQTTYARVPGAVAAPTAGLHFTRRVFEALEARGVERAFLTLRVGPGTFRPVKCEDVEEHRMDPEQYDIPARTAEAVDRTREGGGRVVAVGTTVTRTLEHAARSDGSVRPGRDHDVARTTRPGRGEADLFILPGHEFKAVDALLTNFHLPRGTPLMLTSAFAAGGARFPAGRDRLLAAYAEAIRERYRFFSYGDAMLVL